MKKVIAKLQRVPVGSIRHCEEEVRVSSQRALRRKRGRRIPPVLLVRFRTYYRPLDGNNRVAHALRSGTTHIRAYVITQQECRRLVRRIKPWLTWSELDDDIWVSKTKTYADLHIRT